MTIRKIGMVGSGAMGTGIAHVAAQSGFAVRLFDEYAPAKEKSLATICKLSAAAVEKGKQTAAEREEMLGRLEYVDSLEKLTDCDLIIEAIEELFDAKVALFKQLDAIMPPGVIIATNTSSMSITALAGVTKRPDKVAGMHFFNPAQVMKLVEVIRGHGSADDTINTLKELAVKMGKAPVEVKRDTPGFIVNRLMLPQIREAVKILEEGVASIEDIDTAMKLGLNHPMGPFTLMDFTGIDVHLFVLEYFRREMGDAYMPPLLLKQIVQAGNLGKKTGRGWYDYDK
ncbi:MAG TPA: 3-hydroxyacyl-CoA dehydrogenase NAD-binding domain-containing protein [Negativicutes bacterium]|nr:3-hydroxyacyl-CoA dehydrogenase NAD-binding domain-containing protein [Negativicutes bacterium]